ncbi:MAG: hypothetical protein KDK78_00370, partial [Chlamydiia bacterium]|nr:hypothetical protein [Chlamydiia bacterium]
VQNKGPEDGRALILSSPAGFSAYQFEAGTRLRDAEAPVPEKTEADVERMLRLASKYGIELDPKPQDFLRPQVTDLYRCGSVHSREDLLVQSLGAAGYSVQRHTVGRGERIEGGRGTLGCQVLFLSKGWLNGVFSMHAHGRPCAIVEAEESWCFDAQEASELYVFSVATA